MMILVKCKCYIFFTVYICYKHGNNSKRFYRCDFNQYTISYILRIGDLKSEKNVSKLSTITINDESDFSIEELDTD